MNSLEVSQCQVCSSERLLARDEETSICLDCGFINRPNVRRFLNIGSPLEQEDVSVETTSVLDQWKQSAKTHDATEKRLVDALIEISRLGMELSVSPKVLENAAVIYRKLVMKRLLTRLNIKTLCAATIYASCRQLGHPVSLNLLSKLSTSSKRDIGKSYRFLVDEFKLVIPRFTRFDYTFPDNFSEDEKALAGKLFDVLSESRLTVGRNPSALTSGVCYIVSQIYGSGLTQRELSIFFGVTELSIRRRYKEILKSVYIDVNL